MQQVVFASFLLQASSGLSLLSPSIVEFVHR